VGDETPNTNVLMGCRAAPLASTLEDSRCSRPTTESGGQMAFPSLQ
jgi:hypothetical protein